MIDPKMIKTLVVASALLAIMPFQVAAQTDADQAIEVVAEATEVVANAAESVSDALEAPVVDAQATRRAAALAVAIQSETAEQAVELATVQLLDLIDHGKAYADEDPERFYRESEELLRPLIDFPRFARNVMGVFYRTADDAQRERFAESFKWSLVRTYAFALTEFGGGSVKVLAPRRPPRNPDKVSVTQEIEHQGSKYVVVYLMQRDDARAWRVRNLVLEGVNIGLNYKSQFAAAMKDPQYDRDLDKVIDAWTDFIETDDETNPVGAAASKIQSETQAAQAE